MELVSEAIAFAVQAHDGMRRKKSDAPYILHPMEAAVIVGTMTADQHMIGNSSKSVVDLFKVIDDHPLDKYVDKDKQGCKDNNLHKDARIKRGIAHEYRFRLGH